MKNLILFGGTFDPIHNGHLAIAKAASLILSADVVFIPAKSPRWKETQASSSDRLEMLNLALKELNFPAFSVDTFEMNSNAEINYSIDTVKHFSEKYPNTKLFLLIGADQVNRFREWKNSEELIKFATIIYVGRPEYQINEDIVKQYNMKRLPYDELFNISSSDVRNLKCSEIPSSVRKYIEDHNLYYIKRISSYLTPKRLNHSISVANLALDIAKSNNIEHPNNAYIAGILHDIGKYVDEEKAKNLMISYFPEYIYLNKEIWHQFIGAYLVENDFNIHNPEIIDAIKFHTTGKCHAPALSKIIYCSDKIEPTRGFDSSDLIKTCKENYYIGFLNVLRANFEYFKEHNVELDDQISKPFYTLYCGEEIWRK